MSSDQLHGIIFGGFCNMKKILYCVEICANSLKYIRARLPGPLEILLFCLTIKFS